jgi:HAE1 family hydrophobic/amphiphilic exporter-1
MLSATFIDLFYIPLFFVLVSRMFKEKQPEPTIQQQPDAFAAPGVH